MSESRPLYCHCIFAEDVRQEVSGQYSIIGAFQGGMQVQECPAAVPKIHVVASLAIPPECHFSEGKIELLFNDDVLRSSDLNADFVEETRRQAQKDPLSTGFFIQAVIGLVPFRVEHAGLLLVRVTLDSDIVRSNALRIQVPEN